MKHLVLKKYNKYSLLFIISFILIGVINFSCKKTWLDAKPQKSLAIPSTLEDFKALLSSTTISKPAFNDFYAMTCELGTDDFYVDDGIFNSDDLFYRNLYSWKPDIYGNTGITNAPEWTEAYTQVYYANIVLEGIEKIVPLNNPQQKDWDQIKGSALFFRAVAHYSMARQFCKPYEKTTAASELGIPIRLHSDFNEVSVRSSIQETYNSIIGDLKESAQYLPFNTPINNTYKCLSNKAAAYAMLARVYLAMSDYENAFLYSNKSLGLYSVLLDYNDASWVDLGFTGTAFKPFNPEMLFYKRGFAYNFIFTGNIIVDSTLYNLYDPNDLRLNAFFLNIGFNTFKGSYDGEFGQPFTGLATDEVYLIRAESNARLGRKTDALNDINTLLLKRWNNASPFQPIDAADANEALKKILLERRKELCFRGLRWEDLRRLNREPQFAVTPKRIINGQNYSLPPNSPLYVLPIPEVVIRLSGISQNPR
jgi:hypothetical protein